MVGPTELEENNAVYDSWNRGSAGRQMTPLSQSAIIGLHFVAGSR